MHGWGGLWEVGFFIGVVLLGAAFVYGIMSYNRRNRANEPVTEEATRQLYANTDTYGGKEEKLRSKTRP